MIFHSFGYFLSGCSRVYHIYLNLSESPSDLYLIPVKYRNVNFIELCSLFYLDHIKLPWSNLFFFHVDSSYFLISLASVWRVSLCISHKLSVGNKFTHFFLWFSVFYNFHQLWLFSLESVYIELYYTTIPQWYNFNIYIDLYFLECKYELSGLEDIIITHSKNYIISAHSIFSTSLRCAESQMVRPAGTGLLPLEKNLTIMNLWIYIIWLAQLSSILREV